MDDSGASDHDYAAPLFSDPKLRASILEQLRNQRLRAYAGVHRPWMEDLALADDEQAALAARLADYDVWVASQLMPGQTVAEPEADGDPFDRIAEERSRLIAEIEEQFGPSVAQRYDQTFPGPIRGEAADAPAKALATASINPFDTLRYEPALTPQYPADIRQDD